MFTDTEAYLFSDNVGLRKKYNNDVVHLSKEIYRLIDVIDGRDDTIKGLKEKVKIREIGIKMLGKKVNAIIGFTKKHIPDHDMFVMTDVLSPFGKQLNQIDAWYKEEIIKELKENNIPLDRIKEIWHGNS